MKKIPGNSTVAEIRHDYRGMTIYVPLDRDAAHIHARYGGYDSAFDSDSGEEIAGDLPLPRKKLLEKWFLSEKETDMANWRRDAAGNWHRPPVRKADYDLDKPWSKDNDFLADMVILRAIPFENYDVELWFANGSHKLYNLRKTIDEVPEIAALNDLRVFMNIIGIGSGLHWNGDVDLDAYEFFKNGRDI